ncbi:MAG TPA: hypothetical protein DEG69_00970 [Flavobacteriaceae bacterium]|jgi:hypothetical protein|nr:hypothetical protein [Flavobacteriaceae bacterium]|tara:strand:+ start:5098 stop:5427 length:330 start_codon:yes stop_codon:yes gene_type:complete
MENQIVDIEFEDSISNIAQIRKDLGSEYLVSILDYCGYELWDFDEDLISVPKESISGFYDTTNLESTGLYEQLKNGSYTLVDHSDDEYVLPSDDESDDSGSDVSLDDEF